MKKIIIIIIVVILLIVYGCWFGYMHKRPKMYIDSQEYKEIMEYNTSDLKKEIVLGEPFDSMTESELISEIGLDFEDKNILEFRYENEVYKYHILNDGSKLILDNANEISNLLVPAEIPVHFNDGFSGKVKSMKHQYLIDDEGSIYVGDVSNSVSMYYDYTPEKYEFMFKKISDDVKYDAICNLQFEELKMGNRFNNYSFFSTHLFYNNHNDDVLFVKNKDDIIQYLDTFDHFVDLENKFVRKLLLHKKLYGVYELSDVGNNKNKTEEYLSLNFNDFVLLDYAWGSNRNYSYIIDYNLKQLLPTKVITSKEYYEESYLREEISSGELDKLIPKDWFVEATYSFDEGIPYLQVKYKDNVIKTYRRIEDYQKALGIIQNLGIDDFLTHALFYIAY